MTGLSPADLRLLSSANLEADESLLTGESLLVEKDAEACHPEVTEPAERSNLLFVGSTALRIEPISLKRWATIATVALVIIVAGKIYKRVRPRDRRARNRRSGDEAEGRG